MIVGSFLNVVIVRLPLMMRLQWRQEYLKLLNYLLPSPHSSLPDRAESERRLDAMLDEMSDPGATPQVSDGIADARFNLAFPPSHCPQCHATILAIDNIPILSYLLLKGRCRKCKAKIPFRYLFIEALACLSGLYVAWHFGISAQTLAALFLTWSLLALTVIDIDHFLLPDEITLPLLWLGLIANLCGLFTDISSSVLGALFGYLTLWLVNACARLCLGKEGMGHGDFKLLAALGAWLGWQALLLIILCASLAGSLYGIAGILTGQHKAAKPLPFGPWLALGGWIALLHGNELMALWLH
ncbi:MAG: prepilin peptidase [Candidatus Eutrophobiaceae bacterium]